MDNQPSKVGLSRASLAKGCRLECFIEKYLQAGSFFLRGSWDSVVLCITPEVTEQLKSGEVPLSFSTTSGGIIRLSELQKTREFGGKGSGSSTVAEDSQLNSLKDQLNLLQSDGAVDLTVGNSVYSVSDVVSTPGTPKSDFHFTNEYGDAVAWVSHKDGKTAKAFGQWGGVSDRELNSVYEQHPEIEDEVHSFVDAVRSFVGREMPRATTIARPIRSEHLKMVSVFGLAYGDEHGEQNVTTVLQGCVKIEDGHLVGSGGTHANGSEFTDEYEPMIMAMYKGDRNQFGIEGARFSIYPRGGRKIHYEL